VKPVESAAEGAPPDGHTSHPETRGGATQWFLWSGVFGLVGWAIFVLVAYREHHRSIILGDGVTEAPGSSFVAALVLVLASTSLGEAVVHRFFLFEEPETRVLTGFGLGSGALAWVFFSLGVFGLLSPFAVWPLVLIALAVGVRPLLSDMRSLARRWPSSVPAIAYALGFLALLLLLHSLAPPSEWDELAYHLPIPLHAAETGRFALAGDDFSYFPQLCESLTAAGLLLGGAISVGRVLHFFFAIALGGVVFAATRELVPADRRAAWLGLSILAVEPVFVAIAPIAGIDLALSFFALLGVWILQKSELRRMALLAGVLGGFACGTSYRGILALLALAAAAVAARRTRVLWVLALGGAIGAAPWYLRNLIATGNPLYPFLRSVFPTTLLPTGFSALGWPYPEIKLMQTAVAPHTPLGERLISLVRLPWDMTIVGRSSTHGRFDADISPIYLAALPALALIRFSRFSRAMAVWLTYAAVHSILWAIGPSAQGSRYQMSVLAVLAVVLPALFQILRARPLRLAASGVAVAFCSLLYVATLIRINPRNDALYVFGRLPMEDYLRTVGDAPLHEMVRALNAEPPSPGPVLMIGEKRTLYLDRPVIPDFDLDNLGVLYRNGGKTADGMAALLRRSGIRHILEHTYMAQDTMSAEEKQAYDEMVSRYTETRAQAQYLVWRSLRQ
jgi:hypothetical protein